MIVPRVREPLGYAGRLAAALAGHCDGALRAAYLHGSGALGGWVAGGSDVDMLVVVADDIADQAIAAAGELLGAAGANCPGSGLEASLVTVGQAGQPGEPWPFVLHVASTGDGGRLVRGGEVPGDVDLLMHYAVCREAGIAVLGPSPADLIGPVSRPLVLGYLAGELGWGLAHASERYVVLNACRALVYLRERRIVSKVAGGRAALAGGLVPQGLARRALSEQTRAGPPGAGPPGAGQRPGQDAIEFVRGVIGALAAGS